MPAGLRDGEPRLQNVPRQAQMPDWKLFARFWALTTLWYFVSSAITPADAGSNAVKVFMFQPARLLLYAGYFGLGVYADRRGWFRAGGYQPGPGRWGPAACLSGTLYLATRMARPPLSGVAALALQAALFNAFCLSAVLAATALFTRLPGLRDIF